MPGKKPSYVTIIVCLALTAWLASGASRAQMPEIWFVFMNGSTRPATIGVATSRFSEPGWGKLSAAFGSDSDAWKAACKFHQMNEYYAPEIAIGNVICASITGDGEPTIIGGPPSTETGAGKGGIWFVFMSGDGRPANIGVATSSFSEPGWGRLSAAFGSDVEAWNAACKFHQLPEYFSPEISNGTVSCGDLPANPVNPMVVGDIPTVVGDIPPIVGDIPPIIGDIPPITGDIPPIIEDVPSIKVGSGDIWFVFMNGESRPSIIGVATSRFSEAGWGKLSAAFGSAEDAWNAACKFHQLNEYYSPEIDTGIVSCGDEDDDGVSAAVKAQEAKCGNSFVGTWDTSYNKDTRIWSVGGDRVEGDYKSGRMIEGRIEGCKLIGEWVYLNGSRGTIEFTLTSGGRSFEGFWSEPGGRQNVTWTGKKTSDDVTPTR